MEELEYGGYIEIDGENIVIDEESEETTSHFVIENDQQAEWAMSQIRKEQAEKAKWKEWYTERMRKAVDACDRSIANLESMLQRYFESVPHRVSKTQESYALPSGKLCVKKQEPEYERDDEALVAWLKANGGSEFIEESVSWGNLKRAINVLGDTVADRDGQVIPCIKAIPRPDVFKVELKKEDK